MIDGLLCLGLATAPWLTPLSVRPYAAGLALVLWFVVGRPTWRGLASFYLTGALTLSCLVALWPSL